MYHDPNDRTLNQTGGISPALLCLCVCLSGTVLAENVPPLRLALLTPSDATSDRIGELQGQGYNAIGIRLDAETRNTQATAASRVRVTGLQLAYWFEIGRNPELARAHPEWMASIQTHTEWRRYFPNAPKPGTNEAVKAYPWVPVLYAETFPVHLARAKETLRALPSPDIIFLNDLQGPPSACGCGHTLCRWTTDYGPLTTATRLPADAAAKFVSSIKQLLPTAQVIPVWATECEEHDRDGRCGGVGCYEGACWREFTQQLTPLASEAQTIGALVLYLAFDRDLPIYGPSAGWIRQAIQSFQTMPARYSKNGIPAARILPILQGWDITPAQLAEQKARASEAGSAGYVVSYSAIDQSWDPRIIATR